MRLDTRENFEAIPRAWHAPHGILVALDMGMTALKLGIPSQVILIMLLATPVFVQAQGPAVTASQAQGLKFRAQAIGNPTSSIEDRPSGFFPTLNKPAASATAPATAIPAFAAAPPPAPKKDDDNKQMQQMAQQLMSALGGGNGVGKDGLPTRKTDFDKFEYSKNQIYNSGSTGLANIGNGLCTAKNEGRDQVKLGYCQMLNEVLSEPGSCANRHMNTIIDLADANQFGDMGMFCSTFNQMTDRTQKSLAILQILAGLVVQESGWRPRIDEPKWKKGNADMGGMGLFQIGLKDVGQDPDCRGLNSQSIYDPKTNMKCGACIALKYAAKDKTMGHGIGDANARGIARYFGPFRESKKQKPKREAIAAGADAYCKASTSGNSNGPLRAAVGNGATRSTAAAN